MKTFGEFKRHISEAPYGPASNRKYGIVTHPGTIDSVSVGDWFLFDIGEDIYVVVMCTFKNGALKAITYNDHNGRPAKNESTRGWNGKSFVKFDESDIPSNVIQKIKKKQ